jgi:folylpolyglutamate synthase/dihydropteroate synthase
LGKSIKKIAKEKLGIINNNSLVVFGPQEESLRDLIKDNLSQKRSKGLFYGKDWNIQKVNKIIKYEDYDNRIELNSIGLNG